MSAGFEIGQTFSESLKISVDVVQRFADFSGDVNPIHLDATTAKTYGFSGQVAHGVILNSLLSKLIGMRIPGPGAIWMEQAVQWVAPVFVGDTVTMKVTIANFSGSVGVFDLDIETSNQHAKTVMKGRAKVKMGKKLDDEAKKKVGQVDTALVIGGAGGIGSAIARQLAQAEINVALTWSANEERAATLKRELSALEIKADIFHLNLLDGHSCASVGADVAKKMGNVDIVINAASPKITSKAVETLNFDDYQPFMSNYVDGFLRLLQAFLPHMTEQKYGRVIALGTSAISDAFPNGWGAYLLAKHALWGLVRSMSQELGPRGITVNMVSPSLTVTDLTADIPQRAKEVEAMRNPMRRLATPDDAAAMVAFLASRSAGFVNGQNILINGGA